MNFSTDSGIFPFSGSFEVEKIFNILSIGMQEEEGIAKLALRAKFDDFFVGSVSRKATYPVGHRRFARNPNPTWTFD